MLTLRQIDDIPDTLVKEWETAENKILSTMIKKIAKLLSLSDDKKYQEKKLLELGLLQEDINKILEDVYSVTENSIYTLIDEAATRTLNTDDRIYKAAGLMYEPLKDNKAMQRILNTQAEQLKQQFRNYTNTTVLTARDFYIKTLDNAYLRVTSGAFSYQASMRMAIKELTNGGIYSISFPSGRRDFIDTAVRRNILTGVSQAAAKVQEQRYKEMGATLVETTAHLGARTGLYNNAENHSYWQGKVYYWSLTGEPNTTEYLDFIDVTGYGTGEGLGGWNCRHSFYPYYEGISEVANTIAELKEMQSAYIDYKGEKLSIYEATQKQRQLERKVRRWKRELNGMEQGNQDTTQSKNKLAYWQSELRFFIKETNFTRDYFREQILENSA